MLKIEILVFKDSEQVGEVGMGLDSCKKKKNLKYIYKVKLKTLIMKKISECKRLQSLIKKVVKRNITIIYQKEYDDVSMEYVKIVKNICNANDEKLDEVLNVYPIQKAPDPNLNF